MKRAQRYASGLGARLAVAAKERPGPDAVATVQVMGDVKDRKCLIVDDMASTGRTLCSAAEALRAAGALEVHAAFTHAVMAAGAAERIRTAGFGRILTTDSTAAPLLQGFEVVPVAPLLARSVREVLGLQGG